MAELGWQRVPVFEVGFQFVAWLFHKTELVADNSMLCINVCERGGRSALYCPDSVLLR